MGLCVGWDAFNETILRFRDPEVHFTNSKSVVKTLLGTIFRQRSIMLSSNVFCRSGNSASLKNSPFIEESPGWMRTVRITARTVLKKEVARK
jgi:hypothetical protein